MALNREENIQTVMQCTGCDYKAAANVLSIFNHDLNRSVDHILSGGNTSIAGPASNSSAQTAVVPFTGNAPPPAQNQQQAPVTNNSMGADQFAPVQHVANASTDLNTDAVDHASGTKNSENQNIGKISAFAASVQPGNQYQQANQSNLPHQGMNNGQNNQMMSDDEQLRQAIERSKSETTMSSKPSAVQVSNTDAEIQRAMEESLKTANNHLPLVYANQPPSARLRQGTEHVGLQNVGNTCYMNSLLQTYFHVKEFADTVMSIDDTTLSANVPAEKRQFLAELRSVFAQLHSSNCKFIDPNPALVGLRRSSGEGVAIGDQEDASEFNMLLMTNIEEPLGIQSALPQRVETAPAAPDDYVAVESNISSATQGPNNGAASAGESSDFSKEGSMEPCTLDGDQNSVNGQQHEQPQVDSREDMVASTSMMESSDQQPAVTDSSKDDTPVLVASDALDSNAKRKELAERLQRLTNGVLVQKVESDGKGCSSTRETFGQLVLSITNNDSLESALDDYTHTEVEAEEESSSGVKKIVTFESLPEVLAFQLNRTAYDTEKKQTVKVHKKVEFPKTISMDRFMSENQDWYHQQRGKWQDLRSKRHSLEDRLSQLKNYASKGLSVSELLGLGSEATGKLFPEVPGAAQLAQQLSQMEEVVTKDTEETTASIANLRTEEDDIWASKTDHVFRLFSVLVHSGEAGSGHYWAYILHNEDQKWIRYSDINLDTVDESAVFEHSYGGETNSSAYCLFYVRDSIAQSSSLGLQLPGDLQQKVHDLNQGLEREIEQHRMQEYTSLADRVKTKSESIVSGIRQLCSGHGPWQVQGMLSLAHYAFVTGKPDLVRHLAAVEAVSSILENPSDISTCKPLASAILEKVPAIVLSDEGAQALNQAKEQYRTVLHLAYAEAKVYEGCASSDSDTIGNMCKLAACTSLSLATTAGVNFAQSMPAGTPATILAALPWNEVILNELLMALRQQLKVSPWQDVLKQTWLLLRALWNPSTKANLIRTSKSELLIAFSVHFQRADEGMQEACKPLLDQIQKPAYSEWVKREEANSTISNLASQSVDQGMATGCTETEFTRNLTSQFLNIIEVGCSALE